jgi:hypothetical protein
MDCGFEQATWPVRSVKLFAFFGEVGPRGGGTMLLPGTHRLVDRYREGLPGHGRPLVGAAGEIDGVPLPMEWSVRLCCQTYRVTGRA